MSRLQHDTHGVLGLALSNIGLFIASGFLLAIILNGAYGSLWERNAELSSMANTLDSHLETLNAAYTDMRFLIRIPSNLPDLRISCSTAFIRLSTQGSFGTTLTCTHLWRLHPWPRNNITWNSGDDLRLWLKTISGHFGTERDPVNTTILESLKENQTKDIIQLAFTPVEFLPGRPFVVEKITVYSSKANVTFFLVYQPSIE